MLKKLDLKTIIVPLLSAIIWGCSFTSQRVAVRFLSPFTINGTRFIIGGGLLALVNVLRVKKFNVKSPDRRSLIKGSLACGASLFFATNVQQFGMINASAGKSGFITALYMVLVPIFSCFLPKNREKIPVRVWIAVVIALCGSFLLSVSESFDIVPTDSLLFAAAVGFAVQILFINHYVKEVDSLILSSGQFIVAGIGSLIIMFITGEPNPGGLIDAFWPIMYLAFMSTGVAYTLQVLAINWGNTTRVTLINSLESVFAAIFGAILLNELLSLREIWGCVLMGIAVLLSELPVGEKRK